LVTLPLALLDFPASAETVAWSDLEGSIVDAQITRIQTVQRKRRFDVRVHDVIKITIEADKTIEFSAHTTSRGPRGARKQPPRSGTFMLGASRGVGTRGGGEAVWTFADGTLTFIRTFQAGARRIAFAFARDSSGLTCKASFAFAREDGRKPIRLKSPTGEMQTIVSAKQISSQCKVAKK
jgi:hypothetical protein